jgi:hypothetical protein
MMGDNNNNNNNNNIKNKINNNKYLWRMKGYCLHAAS